MISWSINYLFLVNSALLALLATFLVWRRPRPSSWIFCGTSLALAVWNSCIYLLEERLLMSWLGAIVSVQLISAMLFANGLYYFCSTYPVYRMDRRRWANVAVMCALVVAIVFTDAITKATLVDGNIVYEDGIGYLLYSLYLTLLGLSALFRLAGVWREYPEHRARVRYFFIGVATYVSCAIVFNLILPSLGNYDYLMIGRLSATVAPVLFFYAITKYDFLDVTVIINKTTAWAGTLVLMLALGLLLSDLSQGHPLLSVLGTAAVIVISGVFSQPLQRFLLTTAKRKFVRGFYSTEAVIAELASQLTLEKDRRAIFRAVEATLDRVFEVEETLVVLAVRDENGSLAHYKVEERSMTRLASDSALITALNKQYQCRRVRDLGTKALEMLEMLGLSRDWVNSGVVLPCHSPEFLEGIIVLGRRSNERSYNDNDLRFFDNLLAFLSPILYRLTPMETLEQLYFENKQRLHEAEIQLIRAQKIDAIVHATRQCHHEIRTPLSIISLGISRIKNLDELETFKEVAKEEIQHALEIVEETLTIADVSKEDDKSYVELNVNDVIRRCLRLINTLRYKVSLDLEEVPPVLGYFSDLQVVITNLIHNAIEAMPEGGTLFFSSRATSESVLITVEDTGGGIPDELKSRVWEPYFSGRATRAGNSTAGRGWGLTIVNRIVTEHGGTIRFVSEPGNGTRFTIALPLARKLEQGGNVIQLPRTRA
jgi:signal transduction histidine kinase